MIISASGVFCILYVKNTADSNRTNVTTIISTVSHLQTKTEPPQPNPKPNNETILVKTSSLSATATTTASRYEIPRPQYVFHIQYHKTGNHITVQYRDTVRKFLRAKKDFKITRRIVDLLEFNTKPTRHPYHIRREHHDDTGCPLLMLEDDNPIASNVLSSSISTQPSTIHLVYFPAPDFMCNLHDNDVFMQKRINSTGEKDSSFSDGDPPLHDVKFIHMIRDPYGTYALHSPASMFRSSRIGSNRIGSDPINRGKIELTLAKEVTIMHHAIILS